jgi:hypothetical protein
MQHTKLLLLLLLLLKGKAAPVLLTEYHAMKAYWGIEVFFDLGTRWR